MSDVRVAGPADLAAVARLRRARTEESAGEFVLADHRRGGLGTRMLEACTAYADAHGFARVVLSPSERSVPLYARHGFEPATSLMVRQA